MSVKYINPAELYSSYTPLTTNAQGFAEGHKTIPPSLITSFGLHGVTLGIVWTLTASDGTVAYSTPSCINVALD